MIDHDEAFRRLPGRIQNVPTLGSTAIERPCTAIGFNAVNHLPPPLKSWANRNFAR